MKDASVEHRTGTVKARTGKNKGRTPESVTLLPLQNPDRGLEAAAAVHVLPLAKPPIADADLACLVASLVASWDRLPSHIKTAIKALVATALPDE